MTDQPKRRPTEAAKQRSGSDSSPSAEAMAAVESLNHDNDRPNLECPHEWEQQVDCEKCEALEIDRHFAPLRHRISELEHWLAEDVETEVGLRQRIADLEQWQQDMVAKAADEHLEGYREMADKIVAREEANEKIQADRDRLRAALKIATDFMGKQGNPAERNAAFLEILAATGEKLERRKNARGNES